jgi:thiol-disulfide isomerase/thioredoxin
MLKGFYSLVTGIAMLFCQEIYSQTVRQGIDLSRLELQDVQNYNSSRLSLGDLKGKLVVLDFWGTNCFSCIHAFGKLDSFQKEFGDQIQIILVNKESKAYTQQFFAKRRKLRLPNIPFVMGDTILNKIFPHTQLPYHIWIGRDGVTLGTTDGYRTTRAAIRKYLENGNVQLPTKKPRYKMVSSFFDSGNEAYMEYYSSISHCNEGYRILQGLNRDGVHLVENCTDIRSLFIKAYNEGGKFDFSRPGRCILNVKEDRMYSYPTNGELIEQWQREYCYTYDLYLPKWKEPEQYSIMKEDLRRYFRLQARIEKRKIKVMALIRTHDNNLLKTKGGEPADQFFTTNEGSDDFPPARFIRNLPIENLAFKLQWIFEQEQGIPFVDQTGIKGNIDICVDGETMDRFELNDFRKAIQTYGLDLVEKWVEVDVLILNDEKSKRE